MEQEKDFNETESTKPLTEYQQNSSDSNQENTAPEAEGRRPYRPRFTRSYGERGGYRSSYQRAERPYRPQYKERSYGYRPRYNQQEGSEPSAEGYQPRPRFSGGYQPRHSGQGFQQRPRYNRPYGSRPAYGTERQEGGFQPRGYQRNGFKGGFNKPYRPYRKRTEDYDPSAKYNNQKVLRYKEENIDPNEPIRLNRFLANAGVCSRREADTHITSPQPMIPRDARL